MSDLISRQAAIEIIKNYCENGCDYAEDNWCPSCQRKKFAELLKALQSAQQWIPCSERLPDEDLWIGGKQFSDRVQMTVYDKNDEDTIVDYGHTIDGEWYSDTADEFIESIEDWKVIAWMPLPEPYKGEES